MRIMFLAWPFGRPIIEHVDANIPIHDRFLMYTKLRDIWHAMHPSIPFFQVAAFIRKPNHIFKLEKNHNE